MRRLHTLIALTLLACLCGCDRKYEEFYFKGTVLSVEMCNSTGMGYLMEIESPAGLGDTVTHNGKLYRNAVMAYRAPRPIMKGETVVGVAYRHRDFAAYNCLVPPLHTLPELGLISVDEDPSVIE